MMNLILKAVKKGLRTIRWNKIEEIVAFYKYKDGIVPTKTLHCHLRE